MLTIYLLYNKMQINDFILFQHSEKMHLLSTSYVPYTDIKIKKCSLALKTLTNNWNMNHRTASCLEGAMQRVTQHIILDLSYLFFLGLLENLTEWR